MVDSCSLDGPGTVGSCSLDFPGMVGSCSFDGPGIEVSFSLDSPGMVGSCSIDCPGMHDNAAASPERNKESWDEPEPEVVPCDASAEENMNDIGESDKVTPAVSEGISPRIAEQYRDVIKLNDYLTTWPTPPILGGTLYQTSHGGNQRQGTGNENRSRASWCFLWYTLWSVQRRLWLLEASVQLLLIGTVLESNGFLHRLSVLVLRFLESGPADVLAKVQRKEITLFRAAEMLNVTVTTLANYLSTLRRAGSSSGDEAMDEVRGFEDSFLDAPTPKRSASRKLVALDNNPDITIVKQEPINQNLNHDTADEDGNSSHSSMATNNNAEHSDSNHGENDLTTNGPGFINAAVEQSFSVNKECLIENIHEDSLIAQLVTYEAVTAAVGLQNMTISTKMIHAVRNASGIRKELLKKKKKIEMFFSLWDNLNIESLLPLVTIRLPYPQR
uniref:Uncharacterized protein n=1 Tax=Timema poppense TaxID=170557 RepID=A0A7R9H6C6_TIMPO|nr:unnamed protein product [Timema poppensis]